mmetsp:Transcript_21780/g.29972  ORF Transcript_21780/g.29972 Transcript_21780/m.29972 type:complete len:411 (-) Transcript_21780:29-1261(-)|eukprot:CAMPEP_0201489778 /NCGR_PEP_ID=MMETSP0151_2-20130828/23689_1 /ASSEMBLY_ACC=CAM_ASM_000257 /TAXON_ID=200890 /ORGANISM="Paramoeba atlantica, Strain 621/1 / CCAP 1560/9" /LENGTH=410 /DNA_ID=CAMNT_0047875471 /DNA_START=53 /DNA_END=1285 /DNA_ORIENTATION=+
MASRAWPTKISSTDQAMNTSNPIRKIVDHRRPPNPAKKLIPLDIGDPTTYGNMDTHELLPKLVAANVEAGKFNGYAHSCGMLPAREAIAQYVHDPVQPLTADDVIITSGCSGALELSLVALANPGDNFLLPNPCFSLYRTIADSKGIKVKSYNLLPEKGWEIDLDHLESLIDDQTKFILINNPSNPCGSVFSEEHVREIVKVAERNALPIVSDEIYADMVFDHKTAPFVSLASLSSEIPILAVGGLAKRFLVPGWRLGWITIHDRHSRFAEVKQGLKNLTTLILGACTLIQSILPNILAEVPQSFYDLTMEKLRTHAQFLEKGLNDVPGLKCIQPKGAMYMMVQVDVDRFKDIDNDIDFFSLLLEEESVSVLPGEVFGAPNFVRLVTCPSVDVLQVAVERIGEFCARHSK